MQRRAHLLKSPQVGPQACQNSAVLLENQEEGAVEGSSSQGCGKAVALEIAQQAGCFLSQLPLASPAWGRLGQSSEEGAACIGLLAGAKASVHYCLPVSSSQAVALRKQCFAWLFCQCPTADISVYAACKLFFLGHRRSNLAEIKTGIAICNFDHFWIKQRHQGARNHVA